MGRIRVKPSKEVSFIGMLAGVLMAIFGVFVAIPTFGAFGIVWTIFALLIGGYHAFNAFSDRGAATQEFDVEGFTSVPLAPSGTADRLQHLESLRARHLITEEEYRKKRAEIIERL